MKEPSTIPHNFGALPPERCDYSSARVVVLPVPYDATASYLSGSRHAPRAIIEASRNMELFDEELRCDPSKVGIATLEELEPTAVSPEAMVEKVEQAAGKVFDDGKLLATLGGEHTISVGVVRAAARRYPKLSVLVLDAHADLRDEYLECKFSHACTGARLLEICPVVQVGVRSYSEEEAEAVARRQHEIFLAAEVINRDDWHERVISLLTDKVYISIDLDVFDIGVMPSVGTPEPGGLGWYEVLRFLKKVTAAKNIVGFDVVELRPIADNPAPDFAAAKLTYKLIGYAARLKGEK